MLWKIATLVESKMVASDIMSLRFSIKDWSGHRAGQHCDIRLTAPDGYQAERSYSIANPPEERGTVEFGVQLLNDGEVSPYLFNLKPGEQIEIKGPLGGHFIWDESMPGPLVLIGGGSGTVPLMCMLRYHVHNAAQNPNREIAFLVSARTLEKIPYFDEIKTLASKSPSLHFYPTITDEIPKMWTGLGGRFSETMIRELLAPYLGKMPMIYVCGPNPF